MGWRSFFGFPEKKSETRAITSAPWQEYYPLSFGQMPSANYGTSVTQNMALSLGAVYSAVRLLASSISTLPVKAYRRMPDGRQPMSNLPQLFDLLVTDGQLVPWLHKCVVSLALRGNAYGLVAARDGFGFPIILDWADPALVIPDDRPGETGWLYKGRPVPAEQIVHIPLFAMPGQRVALSPIGSFAQTVGTGLKAQQYAQGWFDAGGFPPGTFKNTEQTVTPQAADEIKARLGNAIHTRQPLVYGRDWDYNAISVPPEEAQFVQTMKLTTNQIAAIYGIPPEKIGGESGSSMTYANVEQQSTDFVMFTLRPWLVAMETAFSALLPDRQYVKFNSDALIRADLKTRWEVNQIRVQMGAASIDEIREQEDQPPLPNGQGAAFGPSALPLPAAAADQQPSQGQAPTTPLRRVQ